MKDRTYAAGPGGERGVPDQSSIRSGTSRIVTIALCGFLVLATVGNPFTLVSFAQEETSVAESEGVSVAAEPSPTETPVPPAPTPTPPPPTLTLAPTIAPPTPSPTATTSGRTSSGQSGDLVQAAATEVLPLVLTLTPSGPVLPGSVVTGQATWTSISAGKPSGTITYRVFNGSGCTSTLFANAGTMTMHPGGGNLGSVPPSNPITFSTSGSYSWQASYSGDSSYAPNTVCVNATVSQRTPSLGLSVAASLPPMRAGGSAVGSATLTNSTTNAGGTVTYTVFTNSTCTTQTVPTRQSTKSVVNGGVPSSDAFTFTQAGTYYWRATYSGDTNNASATSSCVTATVIGGTIAASVADATMSSTTYSNSASSTVGSLALTVSDGRASSPGWSVTIQSSNFSYSGSSPIGQALPATGFTITSVGAPVVISGQPINAGGPLARPAAVGTSLDLARTPIMAAAGSGTGTYTQVIGVSLVIPATSQVGTYNATLTVLTAAAP